MGRFDWNYDSSESEAYNIICYLEVTLWNIGIPTGDIDGTMAQTWQAGDCDWSSREVRRFARNFSKK